MIKVQHALRHLPVQSWPTHPAVHPGCYGGRRDTYLFLTTEPYLTHSAHKLSHTRTWYGLQSFSYLLVAFNSPFSRKRALKTTVNISVSLPWLSFSNQHPCIKDMVQNIITLQKPSLFISIFTTCCSPLPYTPISMVRKINLKYSVIHYIFCIFTVVQWLTHSSRACNTQSSSACTIHQATLVHIRYVIIIFLNCFPILPAHDLLWA